MLDWIKLMSFTKLSDEQERNIPYPNLELGVHITLKTVEVGSIIGVLGVGPFAAFFKRKTVSDLRGVVLRCGRNGFLVGALMGPLMTAGFLHKVQPTPEAVYDRCYRLRRNEGQVRVDRLVMWGELITVAFVGFVPAFKAIPLLGALSLSVTTATIYAAVVNQMLHGKKEPEKKEAEVKEEKKEAAAEE